MSSEGSLLRSCRKPDCNHLVGGGAAYCCAACARADDYGYGIHADGVLGHSRSCLARHAQRGAARAQVKEER